MWTPGGQLPYEYIKIKKKTFTCVVACKLFTKPPPPTVLLNQL